MYYDLESTIAVIKLIENCATNKLFKINRPLFYFILEPIKLS